MHFFEVIRLISTFDIKKLRKILKDFYSITKIRITVFDHNLRELVSYPDEIAPFCKIVRSCETGRIACAACDRDACERAARQRTTQIYQCHAGLTEAVTPIILNDVLIGYLFFGHVFSYADHESGWESIAAFCHDLPIDLRQLRTACAECPPVTQDYIRSSTHIMLAVASYLVMERMAILQPDQPAAQLDNYLTEHFTEKLTAVQLCNHFRIGKTQLYQLSKELYGCGIAEHIRELRLAKAKELLSQANALPLAQIAQECGYDDYNYFISVFSRVEGCPPGTWKKRLGRSE